jgi:uncharacterized protein (DUF1778 family)
MAAGDFQSPKPPESKVRYQQYCQVRIEPDRKGVWTRAANVRRQNLSDFLRACADAGAATRLHQSDLKKHFHALRRHLNAASAANDVGKPRFGGAGFDRHWHILVPDWDRDGDGGVLDTSHNFARQEKIARLAEHRLGHRFIEGGGAHLEAVVAALIPDHREVALALAAAFPTPVQPGLAFNNAEAQRAKRLGADLSEVRAIVRPLWRSTLTVDDLQAELAKHQLQIVVGDKDPPVWVVANLAGQTLLRVTKAAHVTKAEVKSRLGEAKHGINTGTEEELEPVRAPDEWIGGLEGDAGGDPGTAVRDCSVATESERGECGLGPAAFLEGLGAYVKAIDLALTGDMAALRLCLERILPPRKDRPVNFAFPKITNAKEAAATMSAVLAAVASGELTPLVRKPCEVVWRRGRQIGVKFKDELGSA